MPDSRDRRVRVHYSGPLRIRQNGSITLISPGQPACRTRATLVPIMVRIRDAVTCERCLHLIADHDQTTLDEAIAKTHSVQVSLPFDQWGIVLAALDREPDPDDFSFGPAYEFEKRRRQEVAFKVREALRAGEVGGERR